MKEYGLTHEQLAYVAVAQRKWAAATRGRCSVTSITVEDVFASRIVAWPFHLLECCLVTDGGGALIVTSAERAAEFPKPPVHVLGTGESSETPMISQMADFTESRAFRLAGQAAFAEAGISPADVRHLMIYDAFAHVPIYGLEALGFVRQGRGRRLHQRRQHRAGRAAAAEHQRRRALLHPHGHVRHVRDPGRGSPDPGRGSGPSAGCRDQRRFWGTGGCSRPRACSCSGASPADPPDVRGPQATGPDRAA